MRKEPAINSITLDYYQFCSIILSPSLAVIYIATGRFECMKQFSRPELAQKVYDKFKNDLKGYTGELPKSWHLKILDLYTEKILKIKQVNGIDSADYFEFCFLLNYCK